MSKKLRALAFLVILLASAIGAFAAVDCPWESQPLTFRTQTTSGDPNDQGYTDTSFVSGSGGAEASAQRRDTTVQFVLFDKFVVGDAASAIATAGDSMPVFEVQLFPRVTSGITAGGDTAQLIFQVSNDGNNWTTANATNYAVLDPGSSLQFNRLFTTDIGGTAVPDEDSFFGWGFGRIIIQSDLNGAFEGRITYRICRRAKGTE